MNPERRAIKAMFRVMAPNRAEKYIKAFRLPNDEEQCVILCDVQGLSYVQVSERLNISTECIKRKRQSAYRKMADGLKYAQEKAGG